MLIGLQEYSCAQSTVHEAGVGSKLQLFTILLPEEYYIAFEIEEGFTAAPGIANCVQRGRVPEVVHEKDLDWRNGLFNYQATR